MAKGMQKGTNGKEPKGYQREPKGNKREPKGSQGSQKGARKMPKAAKSCQREPTGSQKGAKGRPKGIQKSAWAPGSIFDAKKSSPITVFGSHFWTIFHQEGDQKSMQKSMSKNMTFNQKATPKSDKIDATIHGILIFSRKGVFEKSTIIAGLFAYNQGWAPSKSIKN